jgi:hypothetical protein
VARIFNFHIHQRSVAGEQQLNKLWAVPVSACSGFNDAVQQFFAALQRISAS